MTLTIGSMQSGEPAHLDLQALIGSHLAIVANAGGGKSGLVRKVLEETNGHIQQIVLDPEDEFYTLREEFDFLVAGGEDGDCPAVPENAAAMATMLLTSGISAVIQLNHLKTHQQEAFVANFLGAMMESPRSLWHPVLVVLDEAHRWAPQDGGALCAPQVKDFTSRGRKRGFTAILSTQRMAKIDKNVTGDVNNWALGRVGQATDRRVAADALGFSPNSADARSLQGLPSRNFYVFGLAMDVNVPELMRVGDCVTTIVQAGQAKVPTRPAPAELKKLLLGLSQAAAAPDIPGRGSAAVQGPSQAEIDSIRSAARAEGYRDGHAEGFIQGTDSLAGKIRAILDEPQAEARSPEPIKVNGVTVARAVKAVVEVERQPEGMLIAQSISEEAAGAQISKPKLRVLASIVWWNAMGFSPVDRDRVCIKAGLSLTASTFGVYVSQLAKDGLIENAAPGKLALTEAGRAVAPKVSGTPRPAELRAMARAFLKGGSQRVFDVLAEAYPQPVERGALADELSLSRTASTLGVYISEASRVGFITNAGPGQVKAADFLFPDRR